MYTKLYGGQHSNAHKEGSSSPMMLLPCTVFGERWGNQMGVILPQNYGGKLSKSSLDPLRPSAFWPTTR
jgi:hypothetical protein